MAFFERFMMLPLGRQIALGAVLAVGVGLIIVGLRILAVGWRMQRAQFGITSAVILALILIPIAFYLAWVAVWAVVPPLRDRPGLLALVFMGVGLGGVVLVQGILWSVKRLRPTQEGS